MRKGDKSVRDNQQDTGEFELDSEEKYLASSPAPNRTDRPPTPYAPTIHTPSTHPCIRRKRNYRNDSTKNSIVKTPKRVKRGSDRTAYLDDELRRNEGKTTAYTKSTT